MDLRPMRPGVWYALAPLVSSLLFAQTTDTATLQGHILDQTKSPISGALVTVTSSISTLHRTARTDAEGAFFVTSLPLEASYTIVATKEGFADGKLGGLVLQ